MGLPLFVVDAFTDRPFRGNPAAVVFLDRARDDEWRANVARELNLSETAFIEPEGTGYRLRWFTPTVEVPLCGHATLAAAHALWDSGLLEKNLPAVFETLSGRLTARRDGEWIVLDLPALPTAAVKPPAGFLDGLPGLTPLWLGGNDDSFIIELDAERSVREARPDFAKLRAATESGILLTAPADAPDCDFVSRCFFPADGIPEDPVTGSAHCALGPFWARKLGKESLVARQLSERGGTVLVRVVGDRVELRGRAAAISRGELLAC